MSLTQGRRFKPIWVLLFLFVVAPTAIIVSCVGYSAFQARRPKDMSNAIWIDAPAVSFGFYHGWWEGCWLESDERTNHCRLYGPGLTPPVVYDGRFLPCDSQQAVPASDLKLRPPNESSDMWLFPGFVVFLENGRILVPAEQISDCRQILEKIGSTKGVFVKRDN